MNSSKFNVENMSFLDRTNDSKVLVQGGGERGKMSLVGISLGFTGKSLGITGLIK